MKTSTFIAFVAIFFSQSLLGQSNYYRAFEFTRADSLRGQLRMERSCFDVKHYDLNVSFDLEGESIQGFNVITFEMMEASHEVQIDLFQNMHIKSISLNDLEVDFRREHNAVFVNSKGLDLERMHQMQINYTGKPQVANNPPWDGGFQWTSDDNGNAWVNVSCQGIGASLWWPNKDHPSDEPDSMSVRITVAQPSMAISNGDLISSKVIDDSTTYHWAVDYPINNYNVTFSIGQYDHFSSYYKSPTEGALRCDYYVMPYNLEKAKSHFKQVDEVLEAFEFYLGPYPFWDDGYALVEVPYLGMEHQSAIAYGNRYNRGYMGGMIPEHMNWDYIIVHETGHEYWGNAVTASDFGELWIQESFCTYMEALFIEYHMGKGEATAYLNTQRIHQNDYPIIAPLDVNFDKYSSSDHYFKGAWVLHTLRSAIDNDDLFFEIFRKFYNDFKFKTAKSKDFFEIVNTLSGQDFSKFFIQYLYHPEIPKLEFRIKQGEKQISVDYRWNNVVEGFDMPVDVGSKVSKSRIYPLVDQWQTVVLDGISENQFQIATDLFLIDVVQIR